MRFTAAEGAADLSACHAKRQANLQVSLPRSPLSYGSGTWAARPASGRRAGYPVLDHKRVSNAILNTKRRSHFFNWSPWRNKRRDRRFDVNSSHYTTCNKRRHSINQNKATGRAVTTAPLLSL
jgi:hypothetical protein